MDHTVANQTGLFDDLLAVLERHRDEPGTEEVRGYLNAAKVNYAQRSVYHLVVSLALALDRLMALPPAGELGTELRSVIRTFAAEIDQASARMFELSRKYQESGGRLLCRDEILEEVAERRGASK